MSEILKYQVIIIGAGPSGLFASFQLGLQNIKTCLIDSLPFAGGQCRQLYPDKPIYDIPGLLNCSASELIDNLIAQIKPFNFDFYFNQTVNYLEKFNEKNRSYWIIKTNRNQSFLTENLIIAGGVGAFLPKILKIENQELIEDLIDRNIFYYPNFDDLNLLKDFINKDILFYGEEGFNSAINLIKKLEKFNLKINNLIVLHRRNNFDLNNLEIKLKQLIKIKTGQIKNIINNSKNKNKLQIILDNNEELNVDKLLIYQGIIPKLNFLKDWENLGLILDKKQIVVNSENFETSLANIYAIGDINIYPGKRKLIVSGFHEATLTAFSITEKILEHKIPTLYTTTSKEFQARLKK